MNVELGSLSYSDVQLLRTALFFDEVYEDSRKAALIAFLDVRLALADRTHAKACAS